MLDDVFNDNDSKGIHLESESDDCVGKFRVAFHFSFSQVSDTNYQDFS